MKPQHMIMRYTATISVWVSEIRGMRLLNPMGVVITKTALNKATTIVEHLMIKLLFYNMPLLLAYDRVCIHIAL